MEIEKSLEERIKGLEEIQNVVAGLQKSIATTTSGTYAERQNLDSRIGDITDRDTPFLDMIKREESEGTSFEWLRVVALGEESSLVAECGVPVKDQSTREKQTIYLKTMAKMASVCDKAQKGSRKTLGDLMEVELELRMREVLQEAEKLAFYGDSGSNALEFDGLYTFVDDFAPDNMINGSGATLDETKIEAAVQAIFNASGKFPNTMFLGSKQVGDITDALLVDKIVYNDPTVGGLTVGNPMKAYRPKIGGKIELVLDPWLIPANSPSVTNSDVFLTTIDDISIMQFETMYKQPFARTALAEDAAVIWDLALKVTNPEKHAVIYNVA